VGSSKKAANPVQFSGEAAFLFALETGQVIAGTAGVPPAPERAVPAIHFSGYMAGSA